MWLFPHMTKVTCLHSHNFMKFNFDNNKDTYSKVRFELTNDANYISVNEYSDFCWKCGVELEDHQWGNFCDPECRRGYYSEVSRDNRGIIEW